MSDTVNIRVIPSPDEECAVIETSNTCRLLWQCQIALDVCLIHVLEIPSSLGSIKSLGHARSDGRETLWLHGEKESLLMGTAHAMPDSALIQVTSIRTRQMAGLKSAIHILRHMCIRQNRDEDWPDEPKDIRLRSDIITVINETGLLTVKSGNYAYRIYPGNSKYHEKGICYAPVPREEDRVVPGPNVICCNELSWELFCMVLSAASAIDRITDLLNGQFADAQGLD